MAQRIYLWATFPFQACVAPTAYAYQKVVPLMLAVVQIRNLAPHTQRSQDEVARFLSAVNNLKHRVILAVCYASGLRISEAVRLTPAPIDNQRMVIRVEQGKGRKDRYDAVA